MEEKNKDTEDKDDRLDLNIDLDKYPLWLVKLVLTYHVDIILGTALCAWAFVIFSVHWAQIFQYIFFLLIYFGIKLVVMVKYANQIRERLADGACKICADDARVENQKCEHNNYDESDEDSTPH